MWCVKKCGIVLLQENANDPMLQDTPLAPVLLKNIAAAAALLNSKG
jgi:hypothetical protein